MLVDEQRRTLAAPRLSYGLLARALFLTIDLLYGRRRSLGKFKVLEVVARVPYQAWESVAYVAITHTHSLPELARRVFAFVEESRHQQDNEQWHLLILEELLREDRTKQGFFRFVLAPQLLALIFYHVSWVLYVLKPAWSYRLNAEFEDHAEHEYMEYVAETPPLEDVGYDGAFAAEYGAFASRADLFRRIAWTSASTRSRAWLGLRHPGSGSRERAPLGPLVDGVAPAAGGLRLRGLAASASGTWSSCCCAFCSTR